MRTWTGPALAVAVLAAGCARTPAIQAPPAATTETPPPPAATPPPAAAPPPAPPAPTATPPPAAAPPPATAATPGAPAVRPPAPARPAPPPTAPGPTPAPRPAEPGATLDLAGLERRLRDTPAIGVLTKLSLKNQVDDLLEDFEAFHRGRGGPALTALRERYDLLLLKVLSLLQDRDPALARDIAASREALWGLLADPVKFARLRS